MTWLVGDREQQPQLLSYHPSGIKTRFAARLDFSDPTATTTNNVAEYEAILPGLRKMKALGQPRFIVKTDSKVITDHTEKVSEARNPELIKYLEEIRAMEKHFKGFSLEHILRNQNGEADAIAKAVAKNLPLPKDVILEVLTVPSIHKKTLNLIQWEDWISPIIAAMEGTLEPVSDKEFKRISQRSRTYAILDGELYKSGIAAPWLKCIMPWLGREILQGIHSSLCGSHIGARALSNKAVRQGLFWPSMIQDANKVVKTCEAC